jgi:hypothetical protein
MKTEHDVRTRAVVSWLREDAHENADRMLINALNEIDHTKQRRSWWPAWRSNRMNTYVKLIAAAAAVLVVAVVGYQFLPPGSGTGAPTTAPSPSPSLLARGEFTTKGIAMVLDATQDGSQVTGDWTLGFGDAHAAVELECTRTTEGGLIVIGGTVTESTAPVVPEATRVAIVFERGATVRAHPHPEYPDPPAATCLAFLSTVTDADSASALEPIGDGVVFGDD